MPTVSVTDARAELPALLDRIEAGEEVTITRHGREVAVLIRPDALRLRRGADRIAEAARLGGALEQAASVPLSQAASLSAKRADALVAQVSASRSRR